MRIRSAFFTGFPLFPERVYFRERQVENGLSLRLRPLFNITEPVVKAAVRRTQRRFRIDLQPPGQVDQRKQDIAEFYECA